VTISQHSLPFLQSESFQTHVGTIHHRAIGPLAHHNSTSAYSPSLTCHLPAPTIGCLHSNDSQTTAISVEVPNTTNPLSMEMSVHCCQRKNAACLHCYPPITLRPSSIVAYLRKRNVLLSHCYNSANVIEPREPHTCNNIYL
jgi:hypothetical protein